MHPGRFDIAEKRDRLFDQVVVIEKTAPFLLVCIARQHLIGDGEQCGAAIAAGDGATALQKLTDTLLLRAEPRDQSGVVDCLRHD